MSDFDLVVDPTNKVNTPIRVFARGLAELEATSSKKDKEAIVKRLFAENRESEKELATLFNYALSPYYTFGIKQFDMPTADLPHLDERVQFTAIHKLMQALISRKLTGNDARNLIEQTLAALPGDAPAGVSVREAVKRVLLKDLRAGVDSTINKARKGTVEVFSCQLANSEMPDIETLDYPVAVEPKFDGVRTIAVKKDGVVTLFSRNGLPFENFGEIIAYLTEHQPDNTIFDGEVLHANMLGQEGYAKLMKRAKASAGKNVDGNPVKYQVFDFMPLSAWANQDCKVKFEDRRRDVESIVGPIAKPGVLELTESKIAANPAVLEAIYREYLAQGFEGVIIKTLAGGYTFKRNDTWMKLKPFDTVDLVVEGFIEGAGKYAGMLGALSCVGIDKGGKKIVTEVGSGFNDVLRAEIWANQKAYQGVAIEVRYQDMTMAQDSENLSLRFPTFVRFRASDNKGKV